MRQHAHHALRKVLGQGAGSGRAQGWQDRRAQAQSQGRRAPFRRRCGRRRGSCPTQTTAARSRLVAAVNARQQLDRRLVRQKAKQQARIRSAMQHTDYDAKDAGEAAEGIARKLKLSSRPRSSIHPPPVPADQASLPARLRGTYIMLRKQSDAEEMRWR